MIPKCTLILSAYLTFACCAPDYGILREKRSPQNTWWVSQLQYQKSDSDGSQVVVWEPSTYATPTTYNFSENRKSDNSWNNGNKGEYSLAVTEPAINSEQWSQPNNGDLQPSTQYEHRTDGLQNHNRPALPPYGDSLPQSLPSPPNQDGGQALSYPNNINLPAGSSQNYNLQPLPYANNINIPAGSSQKYNPQPQSYPNNINFPVGSSQNYNSQRPSYPNNINLQVPSLQNTNSQPPAYPNNVYVNAGASPNYDSHNPAPDGSRSLDNGAVLPPPSLENRLLSPNDGVVSNFNTSPPDSSQNHTATQFSQSSFNSRPGGPTSGDITYDSRSPYRYSWGDKGPPPHGWGPPPYWRSRHHWGSPYSRGPWPRDWGPPHHWGPPPPHYWGPPPPHHWGPPPPHWGPPPPHHWGPPPPWGPPHHWGPPRPRDWDDRGPARSNWGPSQDRERPYDNRNPADMQLTDNNNQSTNDTEISYEIDTRYESDYNNKITSPRKQKHGVPLLNNDEEETLQSPGSTVSNLFLFQVMPVTPQS